MWKRIAVSSVAALGVLVTPALHAQDDPHAACAATGWVPREILARPVALRPGLGTNHEVVSTESPDAQAFYDQGLNYLHGYVWIEAARSFQQALRLDPNLAMAYVGLSRVYSGLEDPDAARAALKQAEERAEGASPRERRRIALRGKQLDGIEDLGNGSTHTAYKKALDEAIALDIDDAELWLLRGNAEEPTAAGRGQRGGVASIAFYLQALRLDPDNGAAHHYLTHSNETVNQIPAALEHGEVYARLAPAIPHAHHMWGHDLRRVGRIDDAIAAFRKTYDLEKAYYAAEGIDRSLDWHHIHNLDLLATAYQHKGQMQKALEVLGEADTMVPVTDYLEYNRKAVGFFFLSRSRWAEALPASEHLVAGQWPATRAMGHVVAGHAFLAQGRADEAKAALALAEAELDKLPRLGAGLTRTRGTVEPDVEALRAEMILRSGPRDEGRERMKKVAEALRAVPGPDAWIAALFRIESMARVARDVGDWDLAARLTDELVDHDKAYGGSQLALALLARHRGDVAASEKAMAAAGEYWRDADPDLPEWRMIRPEPKAARTTSRPE
jgi:tetratricopeptide (TPR) repeat protein